MLNRLLSLFLFLASFALAERVDISNSELEVLQKSGVRVLDIRTLEEWKATGIIPGSEMISYFEMYRGYDTAKFFEQLKERGISADEPIIIVCRNGNRARMVADHMIDAGFSKVYVLKYGVSCWKYSGRDTAHP